MKEFAGSGAIAAPPVGERRGVFRDRKTEVLAGIIRERVGRPILRLLVVGCGSGREAAVLAGALKAEVVGIDLGAVFDPAATAVVDLRRGDATRLEFADRSFDFVYSFHVLEHIPDCTRALAEMRRVLSEDGAYCIGTPNRLRWIGYLGSQDATLREMIAWNFADWKARASGRFRNEFGAHAGFSAAELKEMLERVFSEAADITRSYYLGVYREHAGLVKLLGSSGLDRLLFPAVYFMGRR
jgi:ubiquinone/menaquinone biosynthesis C-methylase UbiE